MRRISEFDPAASTSGFIDTKIANPCGVLYLFNDSLISLTLTFPNGDTAQMPPWFYRPFVLEEPGRVQWSQAFTLASSTPPISKVYGEVYEKSEASKLHFTEGPINRHYIGNTVNTAMGGSTSIQNDGNPAATVWAEATQSGGPASNVSGTVDGSIQFNQWDGATKKLLFQTIANAAANNPAVKALAAGMFMEIVGSLQVDENLVNLNNKPHQWKDNVGTARKVLQVDNNNNTQLYGIQGVDFIQFLKSDGTLQALIDCIKGSFNLSTPGTTINGGTAGTCTMWMPFQGSGFKVLIFRQNGFQTAASNQDVTLPTAFTDGCFFFSGGIAPFSFLNAGAVQNCNVITALAAAGGTAVFQALVNSYSFGNLAPTIPFDGIRFVSGNGSAHTAWIVIIGR